MTDAEAEPPFDPEDYTRAAASVLGLTLDPDWMAPVAANLRVLHEAAAFVGAFPLPDEAEAAPVFEA